VLIVSVDVGAASTHKEGVVLLAQVRTIRQSQEGQEPGQVLVCSNRVGQRGGVRKLDRGADLGVSCVYTCVVKAGTAEEVVR
jgi:hypothetical protein